LLEASLAIGWVGHRRGLVVSPEVELGAENIGKQVVC
jgi:hypothetical protein